MLLHFPIVILATLSPIAVSDAIPRLDVEKECRFEGGSSEIFDRCMRDEKDAQKDLETVWPNVTEADRASCVSESTTGGYTSYIELLTCLEMARDVAAVEKRDPQSGSSGGAERDR
jgi:hypothetical protein